jgi:hypothetical protein
MNGRQFHTNIANHHNLKWVGSHEGKTVNEDEVYIVNVKTGGIMGVPIKTIQDTPWGILEGVLTGVRPARVLRHFTRVVGYYSSVHNWNRSKHAELGGRRAGTYGVEEPEESDPRQLETRHPPPAPKETEEVMELVLVLSS